MDKIKEALLNIPVAVNCYYGDPTLQWKDTLNKLRVLESSGHIGPVSIITRGSISSEQAHELAKFDIPGLLVMYSISGLPKTIEPLGHKHAYQSISNLQNAKVKTFAAVRPLIPPYNTSEEVIARIFRRLRKAGCEIACVSGFRGDPNLIEQVNPDNKESWVLRVKQMTGFDSVVRIAKENKIRLFTRVNCAVSYLTGRKKPFNPYWGSPQLVRCNSIDCPLQKTCGPTNPDPVLLEWLQSIGFDLEYQPAPQQQCKFQADNRLDCTSCCTTCFVTQQPRVLVKNAQTLGDLTFCRFILGGALCIRPGMIDGGTKDVGHVKILLESLTDKQPLHCLNSWWVWANQLEKCFGCTYCISTLYQNNGQIGCTPIELLNLLRKRGVK